MVIFAFSCLQIKCPMHEKDVHYKGFVTSLRCISSIYKPCCIILLCNGWYLNTRKRFSEKQIAHIHTRLLYITEPLVLCFGLECLYFEESSYSQEASAQIRNICMLQKFLINCFQTYLTV